MCPPGKELPALGASSSPEEADAGEWGCGKAMMRVRGTGHRHWHPRVLQGPVPWAGGPKQRENWGAQVPLAALPGTARNHPSPRTGGITLGLWSISNCCYCLSPNATGVRTSHRKSCCLQDPWQGLSLPLP